MKLPVCDKDVVIEEPTKLPKDSVKAKSDYDSSRHTILVVEDSEYMRDYIADELSDTYNILTAAIGVETRIESLEIGADGYIEKPFPIEVLRSDISNLFRNKEISYKQFSLSPSEFV